MQRRTKIKLVVAAIILLLLLGGGALVLQTVRQNALYQPTEQPFGEQEQQIPGLISWKNGWYAPKERLETVLLLGVDATEEQLNPESYINFMQADFLVLAVIDHTAESYTALQLNRDTMCMVPFMDVFGQRAGWQTEQLALAHTHGTGGEDSCWNTVDAVSRLLYDVPIGGFARVDMSAIPVLNDAVDGVTVTLEDDFSAADPTMKPGATLTLQGAQAEIFVRSRKSLENSTNLHRMERQQVYLSAWLEKAKQKAEADEDFLPSTVMQLSEHLTSNLAAYEMSVLSEKLEHYRSEGFRVIPGEAIKGERYMEYYVDEAALRQLVMELFYTQVER